MKARRIITRAIVFLLLGAIVNIAVAWGWLRCPMTLRESAVHRVNFEDGATITIRTPFGGGAFVEESVVRQLGSDTKRITITILEVGLPLPSLWYQYGHDTTVVLDGEVSSDTAPDRQKGALILAPTAPNPYVLPYFVRWPGFAINTIFYAAVLWVLWMTPGFVRRRVRRFRGRCIHCGYDLRGQPPEAGGKRRCPECGEAVHGAAAPCNPR